MGARINHTLRKSDCTSRKRYNPATPVGRVSARHRSGQEREPPFNGLDQRFNFLRVFSYVSVNDRCSAFG